MSIPFMPETYHVYPLNDFCEHVLQGATCWCHPVIDEESGAVIHNAADGRELVEAGERAVQ